LKTKGPVFGHTVDGDRKVKNADKAKETVSHGQMQKVSVHESNSSDVCTLYLKLLGKMMLMGPVPGEKQKKPCVRFAHPL